MTKLLLPKKRKADEFAVEETAAAGDEAEKPTQAGNEPPKKSRKTTTPKKRKTLSKVNGSNEETRGATASTNLHQTTKQASTDTPGAANELVPDVSDLNTNNDQSKAPAKQSRPRKSKIGKTDASKNASPDTSGSSDPVSSPKDSGTEADGAATEGSKTAVEDATKPKKRAPPKKTATNARRSKKQTKEATEPMPPPPPPLPPAPINQQVANKVKQVLLFTKDEQNDDTKLERDPKNSALVSVPYSSFQSAIMRMQAHYEILQPLDQCINDVQDVVFNNFERNIGPTPNIDWITIDVSKPNTFENSIKQKIARHGLDGLSLLEVELKMFTKDLLENTHLFRDWNGEPVANLSNRLLDAVDSAWEVAVSERQMPADQTAERAVEQSTESTKGAAPESDSSAAI